MRRKQSSFLHEIKTTFNIVKQHNINIIFPMISDLLFPITYGFINGYFGVAVLFYLYSLGQAIMSADNNAIAPLARRAFFYLLGLLLVLYLAYVIFQGISWMYSRRFSGNNIPLKDYLKGFALVNIFWYVIFIFHSSALFIIDYYEISSKALNYILMAVMIVVVYFAVISYTLIGKRGVIKSCFMIGTKHVLQLGPRVLGALAIIFALNQLLVLISAFSRVLVVILGVFVLLPALTILRIYLHIAVKDNS
ncbi:MAG: hypothetical protein KKE20_07155 [Nanoarchaeota archaeon]|nr:hypothetical protein [Nanoarchaeota archaeon]